MFRQVTKQVVTLGLLRETLVTAQRPFFLGARMAYSTSSESRSTPIYSVENRDTKKHLLSRKTFLVDYYKYLNDNNEILLYVHHNNLNKAENKRYRSELKKAGAKLNIIRNSIYNIYLRSEHEEDPADAETSERNKNNVHPLMQLLNGPTGIITIPECDPEAVAQVLRVLRGASEKLILIAAKIESKVFDIDDVDKFKDIPSRENLQAQLSGLLTLLGGANLVNTLESSSKRLYLTMDQRRKDLDPTQDDEETK